MIENLPLSINALFITTTLLTVLLFSFASSSKKIVLLILSGWIILQSVISLNLFYLNTTSLPPRFIFIIGPPFLLITLLFFTQKGKTFIDQFDLKKLTLIHTIRIPVEITLLLLYLNGKVPLLMTFEGRNFDILSGISAPFIFLIAFHSNSIKKKLLLIWNFLCLGLLLNIVINAVLSAPFPFQKFAFDQPNVAVLYFPFVLLPAVVVPIVLFSHLISVRLLLNKK